MYSADLFVQRKGRGPDLSRLKHCRSLTIGGNGRDLSRPKSEVQRQQRTRLKSVQHYPQQLTLFVNHMAICNHRRWG